MFRLPQFNFDRTSFWLGFLAATLVWWIFSRIRPLIPQFIRQLRQAYNKMQQRNLVGVDEALRKAVIRRAQHQHVAASLFSLDEVLIQPRLLAPPPNPSPNADTHDAPIASQVIPYLPDWPELTTPLGVPTLTVAEALENGSNIAIIGQPGMGKTVALASLAIQVARAELSAGSLATAVPIFTHALDLDITIPENGDPLLNIMKIVAAQVGVMYQSQVPRLFQAALRDPSRRLLLLLDGLDEVSPDRLDATAAYLKALLEKYPQIQAAITAPVDYLDGLTNAGFYPLSIAAWTFAQRQEFTRKWGSLWNEQLLPEVKRQYPANEIDSQIMNAWLGGETHFVTPLEWVLRLWGAYAGDLSGTNTMTILDGHISRFLPAPQLMPALESLAYTMLLKPTVSLSFDEMEKILSGYKPPQPVQLPGEPEATASVETNAPPPPEVKTRKKTRRDLITSQGEQIINALIASGLFVEHSGGQIRFASLVFLGYLAGLRISEDEAFTISQQMDWPVNQTALQYAAACNEAPVWVMDLVQNPELPLCRDLLRSARWLREVPAGADWRSVLMRTLVSLIQLETVPFATRARLVGAFYLSGDPSTTRLYKQLLVSKSPSIRRLALLGCGAQGSQNMIEDILTLLGDGDEKVRYTASLALAAIPGEAAMNAIVQVLLEGDEGSRQAAAEALSKMPQGHQVLEEAIAVEDLLARRASVYGLVQIREAWARIALERLAVEDGQWVVRNAAAQALETIQLPNSAIPKPLPPASEAPWLLTFAGKLGVGVSPDRPATDILLLALKSGSKDEQIIALQYLREVADEGVTGAIYNVLYGDQDELHEPALLALWWMALSGKALPSPTQFGLG